MKINILGGGPAGLYSAYLLKRQHPAAQIQVYEQNAAGSTFGFGVVFSDQALDFLRANDTDTLHEIEQSLERWEGIELSIHSQSILIDGIGFTAISRLRLLEILRDKAESVGVTIHHQTPIRSLNELDDADLIIGADGVNSLVRQSLEAEFGTTIDYFENHFAWFGATCPFPRLTQTFKKLPQGHFNAHHYRYTPTMSTFLVEVDAATFERVGFTAMSEEESRAYCQTVFADVLGEGQLVANKSHWRRFPRINNARWSSGKTVIIGDALHTAHFSIGSGTRLAMEDVQALVAAIGRFPTDIPQALASFEAERRPIADKIVNAANHSSGWYDHFPEHMQLPAWEFAHSYISRSGRIDPDRLRRLAPGFAANYQRWKEEQAR